MDPWLAAANILDPPVLPGAAKWRAEARPEQLTPPGDWFVWLVKAGRGWGKSRSGAEWIDSEVREGRSGPQVLLAGRTPSDVRDYLLHGAGGLLTHHPDIQYLESKRILRWPNGVEGLVRSGANPEELRGFSGRRALCDELAAWDYPDECWSNLTYGMREGEPRIMVTTTPRPIRLLKQLIKAPSTYVTTGSSYDNRANLSERWVKEVLDPVAGTRTGRQETEGELLEDVEGALWNLDRIDLHRVHPDEVPDLVRCVVGVDPQGVKKEGAETGIVAAGIDARGHYYILEDGSLCGAPNEWGLRAVAVYARHKADKIVAEMNYGGEMVEATIRAVAKNILVEMVSATRGKRQRAEPVSALYDQGLVHHVGSFAKMEDEMTCFTPFTTASPNRMDALVWALSDLSAVQPKKLTKMTWGTGRRI